MNHMTSELLVGTPQKKTVPANVRPSVNVLAVKINPVCNELDQTHQVALGLLDPDNNQTITIHLGHLPHERIIHLIHAHDLDLPEHFGGGKAGDTTTPPDGAHPGPDQRDGGRIVQIE
jgi:hypothetical protein